ncbi:hypothetical protein [Streptomyces sp. NPDC060010]|uniref:hypothetical protein n=1 Tax=Streptomyces sp. NPDC060010 TaxID=3347036 RepID=UPI0036977B01
MSESTVRRWRDELIGLLAAQAPRLDRALKTVAEQGAEAVLIDGTLIRTELVWYSPALPGRTADITAARTHDIVTICERLKIPALADKA